MDTRLFCLVVDSRGRLRVSCRDTDLDRVTPAEYFGTFSAAYTAACKINRHRISLQQPRHGTNIHRHKS